MRKTNKEVILTEKMNFPQQVRNISEIGNKYLEYLN